MMLPNEAFRKRLMNGNPITSQVYIQEELAKEKLK